MKGIVRVIGKDSIGILASITDFLAKNKINILEISQDVIGGYFNMAMIVDITNVDNIFNEIIEEIEKVGQNIGLEVKIQRADIFDAMHRI